MEAYITWKPQVSDTGHGKQMLITAIFIAMMLNTIFGTQH